MSTSLPDYPEIINSLSYILLLMVLRYGKTQVNELSIIINIDVTKLDKIEFETQLNKSCNFSNWPVDQLMWSLGALRCTRVSHW